jgi:Fungal Zn(2)-Cys(6) binuclear cluster domain
MQSLRLPGVPQIPPSFKRHRFDSDPSRFSLNLSLSKPIPTPGWASLPSPPMSGSPPPEHPLDLPQTAGRRRKRSDTPITNAPSRVSTPVVTTSTIVSASPAERRVDVVATTGNGIQTATWPTPYPVTQSYGFGAGASVLAGPGPSPLQPQPQYAVGPTSPKATRKSKVHVPSACVNCKQKHLRCDSSRPCNRCVLSGKEVGRSMNHIWV